VLWFVSRLCGSCLLGGVAFWYVKVSSLAVAPLPVRRLAVLPFMCALFLLLRYFGRLGCVVRLRWSCVVPAP